MLDFRTGALGAARVGNNNPAELLNPDIPEMDLFVEHAPVVIDNIGSDAANADASYPTSASSGSSDVRDRYGRGISLRPANIVQVARTSSHVEQSVERGAVADIKSTAAESNEAHEIAAPAKSRLQGFLGAAALRARTAATAVNEFLTKVPDLEMQEYREHKATNPNVNPQPEATQSSYRRVAGAVLGVAALGIATALGFTIKERVSDALDRPFISGDANPGAAKALFPAPESPAVNGIHFTLDPGETVLGELAKASGYDLKNLTSEQVGLLTAENHTLSNKSRKDGGYAPHAASSIPRHARLDLTPEEVREASTVADVTGAANNG